MESPDKQSLPAAEFEAHHRRALELAPANLTALRALAALCRQTGRDEEAETLLRRAARVAPGSAEPGIELAKILGSQGRHEEAAEALREVVRLAPGNAAAQNNLGAALEKTGKPAEAAEAYRRAIALRPNYAEAHSHLGNALRALGQPAEAEAAHREAIRLKPDYAPPYNNLAAVLSQQARVSEAIECQRQALRLRPQDAFNHSSLLAALHYLPDYSPGQLFAEHLAWARRHEEPILARYPARPFENDRDPDRPLRVGYVSGDFRDHPIARFLYPLLAAHDRGQVAVYCYSDVLRPDRQTQRLAARADAWRDISAMDDDAVADAVRGDRIDVLVDLAGHPQSRRLLVFARRPAPVQVAYMGYPDTTGMKSIGYRITDAYHDPASQPAECGGAGPHPNPPPVYREREKREEAGGAQNQEALRCAQGDGLKPSIYTEQLMRLPGCCWAYDAGDEPAPPEVNELPALTSGRVTFAVFNRIVKVTPQMAALWSRIVRRVPGSRVLVLDASSAGEASLRGALDRLGLVGADIGGRGGGTRAEYLARYHEVDIALDTFPYNGMTTTCDAMWMGVPTVTRAGNTNVSRSGVSVLSAVGLPELIAKTPEEYVEIAVGLASDLPRLAALRAGLRERMRQSPLCDGSRLAREIEAAYRDMWRKWCGRG